MLLREVYDASAHVAPHEAKLEYFDTTAANALNGNGNFQVQFDDMSIRNRYDRLQKPFTRRDREAAMYGVGN